MLKNNQEIIPINATKYILKEPYTFEIHEKTAEADKFIFRQ